MVFFPIIVRMSIYTCLIRKFIWTFAFYVQMSNASNRDPHMARLDKLEALVAQLSASNSDLCPITSNTPSKRPLNQSTIDSDGGKLVFKKPKSGLNLKGPTKMSLKLKTVSSRDFASDDPMPSTSAACSGSLALDQADVHDSYASDDDNDDDDADSDHCDDLSENDTCVRNDIGTLENAFLDSDDNAAANAVIDQAHLDDAEAQNSSSIVDSEGQTDHPDISNDIPIIGVSNSSTWTPPPKAFAWFRKVADMGIPDEQFRSLDQSYLPPDSVAHYFEPAKLPPAVWDSVKLNRGSTLKLKACHRAQSYITSAFKPLLSVLESLDPSDDNRSKLAHAIQLLSSSNLQFNRFKRAMAGPFIKKEFRKTMLSQPITHNCLFGEDFGKTSELALKDVSSSSRILQSPQSFRRPFQTQGRSNSGPSRPQTDPSAVSQASDSGRYNPGYNPYRARGGRGRGNSSFRGRSSGSGYRKKQ